STLCTVMAQLTEETQPTFEVTLSCTMEDAAIYQVSASNTKGIVSCSGVLEVGLMNEYLIHQRYFGKLKQKAESRRRRELEEREDQGAVAEQDPFRNLSPDRAQRKRRSPMALHFSAPGSMEEASVTAGERRHEVPGADAEARLQDSFTAWQTTEKPASVANGTPAASVVNGTPAASVVNGTSAASVVNGHAGVTENGSKGITYMYDPAQKVFTAQQPITPSLKKMMKISNNFEGVKEDAPVGGVSEKRGSRVRPSEKQAPVELVKSQGPVGYTGPPCKPAKQERHTCQPQTNSPPLCHGRTVNTRDSVRRADGGGWRAGAHCAPSHSGNTADHRGSFQGIK
ncbi:hypothetical protein CRUP_005124, partial [Coryphaenoides rupestris]